MQYGPNEDESVSDELWHVMEMAINKTNPGAFLAWSMLNPEGFQYTGNYAEYAKDYDPAYFASGYGTTDPREDRATIVEMVFSENRNEWFSSHPAVKRKLDFMNTVLKETIGIRYNVTVTKEDSR